MADQERIQDLFFIAISIILPLIIGVLVYFTLGGLVAALLVTVFFFILSVVAHTRGWTSPVTLPVVRSPAMSELFLGLGVTTLALAVSWFLGVVISRAFSDMGGILAGLVIFGVIMLIISAARDWQ
jgi:uncharacterized membrane protein